MKRQFLLALFSVLSLSGFSQYSRSLFTTNSSLSRHDVILERSGETEIVSLRKSHGDTLVVTLFSIDANGTTSNYRISEYSPFDLSGLKLSGAGVNSAGKITLNVLGTTGSQSLIRYITVDPITGLFSNFHQFVGSYKKGFTRSRVKGDSLITYLASSTGSLIHRISTSMTNTSMSSTSIADPSISIYPSNYQFDRTIELFIDGSDEYIGFTNNIIKRNGAGLFQQLPLAMIPLGTASIVKNQSGEIVVFRANTYTTISTSFAITSEGTYSSVISVNAGAEEFYALDNGGYRMWVYSGQVKKQIDLDASFNIVSEKNLMSIPLFSTKINGKVYVLGAEQQSYPSSAGIDGEIFQDIPTTLTVVCDDLSSDPQPFIDYDQELEHTKFRFHTNHCGVSFHTFGTGPGLTYALDSLPRSLIYSSHQNFAAKALSGDTVSTNGTFGKLSIPGPYTNAADYDYEQMDKYSRGYYVTREMIEAHISGIGLNDPNYVMPFGIREWPAHGDVSKGQAANLAGFIDLDGNTVYNPENGDYPAIYGDVCLLNIFHGSPLALNSSLIETHQYYFTFNCDTSEDLKNTIFTRTDNFSRNQNLVDLYAGNYVDFDIGSATDDYMGTHVELGMVYTYNGDMNDETSNGQPGFGNKLPAMGMMMLQGVKLNETGVDRPIGVTPGSCVYGIGFGDGIPDNEYYTLESSVYPSYSPNVGSLYQSMTGTFADGTPQNVNGVTVRHCYFGDSDPLFYSSTGIDPGVVTTEAIATNPAGDRRMISGSGPVDFDQQDTLTLYNAYLVGFDSVYASPDSSLAHLFDRGAIIRDMFRSNTTPCGGNFKSYVSESTLSINEPILHEFLLYPNPASTGFRVKGISGEATVRIFDLNGRLVAEETNFEDEQEISIHDLESAIYLVSIEDEIGKQVIRLVKR